MNNLLNHVPFELHIPGYQYCGPGTNLKKRLNRGDLGINKLDAACKQHDIAYSQHSDRRSRNSADRILADEAWGRVKAKDAGLGEKSAALAINNIMKSKAKMGLGVKSKNTDTPFNEIVKAARKTLPKPDDAGKIVRSALTAARKAVKKSGGKRKVKKARVLALPEKVGGVLPLIPIFAGLSALGALSGGAAGVAKAVNDAKIAREQFEEAKRHNLAMEAKLIGKGLYLKPWKSGQGLRLVHVAEKSKKKRQKL